MAKSIYEDMAKSHPSLIRGQVWCRTCGSTRIVDSAHCMANGWPKCCGFTMTIDSPEEQAAAQSGDVEAGEESKMTTNNQSDKGRWFGKQYCPHPGEPCIDGCYYCGRPVGSISGDHDHTKVSSNPDEYSCVCGSC